jgi:biopolymer transport protein ExbD
MAVQFPKSVALDQINLTPLIDCVFLLLIFFLVATRFAEEDRELDVQLPSASHATPLVMSPNDLDLYIDENGKYFLGSRGPLDLPAVDKMLADISANQPTAKAVKIRADLKCDWDYVVRALDTCHKHGLHDVKATAAIPNE